MFIVLNQKQDGLLSLQTLQCYLLGHTVKRSSITLSMSCVHIKWSRFVFSTVITAPPGCKPPVLLGSFPLCQSLQKLCKYKNSVSTLIIEGPWFSYTVRQGKRVTYHIIKCGGIVLLCTRISGAALLKTDLIYEEFDIYISYI